MLNVFRYVLVTLFIMFVGYGCSGSSNSSNSTGNSSKESTESVTSLPVVKAGMSGQYKYSGVADSKKSYVHSRATSSQTSNGTYFDRGGPVNVKVDFDTQLLSGNIKLDTKSGRYGNYRQVRNGASLSFEKVGMYRDDNGHLVFDGEIVGFVEDTLDATFVGSGSSYKVTGRISGMIFGENAEQIKLTFGVKSSEDSRIGASGVSTIYR